MIKNTRQVQISLAILAVILSIALIYAPARKKNLQSAKPSKNNLVEIEVIISLAKDNLSPDQLSTIINWELTLNSAVESDKIAYYDSLAVSWDVFKNPFIAAHFFKQKAKLDSKNESLVTSAKMYFRAYNTLEDSILKSTSINEAVELFEKALEKDPENEEIILDLALCHVENLGNPMKGILMLRDLADKNPKNENVHFNLGILSMRSGQFSKAISRFNQILDINPDRKELFLYIADCYVQLGEKNKAIDYFSRFKSQAKDQVLVDEIDRYIEQLKEE